MADSLVTVRATGTVRTVNVPTARKALRALKPGEQCEALLGVGTGDPAHPCRVRFAEQNGYIEIVKAEKPADK